jgi:outer membrane immunogenic protein
MLQRLFGVVGVSSVLVAAPLAAASAADMPLKAPPAPASASWTGFYIGGDVGGAWADRSATYAANDPTTPFLLSGTLPGIVGEQPLFPNSFNMSGVTGGIDAGYNWQVGRSWLLGVEADFSGANLRGTGSSTSFIQQLPGAMITQTVTEQQTIDWYGTLRGRLGFLPSDNVLLFATGGLAYGRVAESGNYSTLGPVAGLPFNATISPFSFSCTTNSVCFSGSSSSVKTGWTLGGGVEWRVWGAWSLKAEYQYVNLGNDALRLTANATMPAGPNPSSFNATFRDDFNAVRAGVNYHF